jgi:hypothetical protein
MQKRLTLLFGAALCLTLTACGGGAAFRHLQNRAVTEAELLKTEVIAAEVQGEDVLAGDNYLAKATKSGTKETDAMRYADLAAAHYRAALAQKSLELSRESLTAAETALADSEEAVKKYEQILTEISTRKEQ